MDNNILTILTSQDRDEIKQALKDAIIKQIQDDFHSCDSYMFNIDDINKMMQEAIEDVQEEVKPIVKEFMLNEIKKKLKI